MKKLIYPIASIFALITVASFSSDDCKTKCAKKETVKTDGHRTGDFHNESKAPIIRTVKTQMHQTVAIVETEPVAYPVATLEVSDSLSSASDIQIDIQFSREETTIEVPSVSNADEAVTYQFNAGNKPELAYQVKQAAY